MDKVSAIKIAITSGLRIGCGGKDCPVPEDIRLNTLRKIADAAKEHDMLLIAGDFVDSEGLSQEARELLTEQFAEISKSGTKIFYTPGPCELDKDGAVKNLIRSLELTHLFVDFEPETVAVKIGEQDFFIYGSILSPNYELIGIQRREDSGFHIGLFYYDCGFMNNTSDITKLKLDFYAFGNGSSSEIFKINDKITGAMLGNTEAVTDKEAEDRYILSLTVEDGKAKDIKRIAVNSLQVLSLIADCSMYESGEHLKASLMKRASDSTILKLVFQGERNFPLEGIIDSIKDNFFDIEAADESKPSIRFLSDTFAGEDSLRGRFFSILADKLNSRDIDEIIYNHLSEALTFFLAGDLPALEEWLCAL